jgi:hypothetical protein
MVSEIQNQGRFGLIFMFFDEQYISFDQNSRILRHFKGKHVERTGLSPYIYISDQISLRVTESGMP